MPAPAWPRPGGRRPAALLLAALLAPAAPALAMDGGAVVRRDAAAAFARQAAEAAAGGEGPRLLGAYVWSGRADRDYRPFAQWELLLGGGGGVAVRGLEARVATLGRRREVLAQGSWQDLGALAPGARREASLHLACGIFPAYQIELRWAGAAAPLRCIATDRQALPRPVPEGRSWVAVVGADVERDDRSRRALVTWSLWNLGGVPASGVALTIRLRGEDGGEAKRASWSPPRGELAAGTCLEGRLVLERVPAVAGLAIDVQEAAPPQAGAEGPPGADVEVRGLRLEGGRLSGTVRNGLAQDLQGLRLSIAPHGASRPLEVAVGALPAGASRPFAIAAPGLAALDGYELAWSAAQP